MPINNFEAFVGLVNDRMLFDQYFYCSLNESILKSKIQCHGPEFRHRYIVCHQPRQIPYCQSRVFPSRNADGINNVTIIDEADTRLLFCECAIALAAFFKDTGIDLSFTNLRQTIIVATEGWLVLKIEKLG